MAGRAESPQQRQHREEAVAAAVELAEAEAARDTDARPRARAAITASTASRAQVRSGGERAVLLDGGGPPRRKHRPATVASAAPVDLSDRKALAKMRARRQQWQTDAWDYIVLPEVGATLRYAATMMSKIRLFPAVRLAPDQPPTPVDDPASGVSPQVAAACKDILERLRSPQGGQAALIKQLDWNLCEVAGEAYLHGHENPDKSEEWHVRSVDQLVVHNGQYELRTALGARGTPIPTTDLVRRLWDPDPRFSELATSQMKEALDVCEVLLLLHRAMRSDALSHLNSGFLVKAQELTFGPPDPTVGENDGEAAADPFEDNLNATLVDPIEDPGSASAVAPGVITGPAEYIQSKYLWHLTFRRDIDAKLVEWIDTLIMRLARGLSMPVEVVRGLADTTYANAAVAKQSEWEAYGEPRAVLICDALTVAYFRERLIAAGVAAEVAATIFVWYDPAGAIAAPDPGEYADKDHEDGLVSDEARRRSHGWSEADAPEPLEILARMLYKGTLRDPALVAAALRATGIMPDAPDPTPGAQAMPASALAPVQAAARKLEGREAGRRLAAIDRDLRLRLAVAAEGAIRRLLERAGAKVRPKLGRDGPAARAAAGVPNRTLCAAVGREVVTAAVGDLGDLADGAFDELADEFVGWVTAAQAQAVRTVERYAGPLSLAAAEELAQRQSQASDAARTRLVELMAGLAARRLYDPAPGAPAVGEGDASATVPAWLVREVLAVAGGDKPSGGDGAPMESANGGPVGGVATGPDVMAVAGGVEGYEWDYGSAPRQPFEPHLALDGVQFRYPDDDVLANNEGWPDAPFFMPGDHGSCQCDVIPVLLDAEAGGE